MTRRAITIAEGLGLAAVAGLYLSLVSGTWFITPDSIDYVEGAHSLARSGSYAYADGEPATFFPVGTSAIYALAAAIPSVDYRFFNLLTKLLTIAYVGLGYVLVRRHAGRVAAVVTASLMVVSPTLLFESTRLLSDIPYAVVLTLTFVLFDEHALDRLSVRGALGLGLLLASALLVRTVGVALSAGYLAWIVTSASRGRWRAAGVVIGIVGAAAALHVVRARTAGGPSYGGVIFARVPWMSDSGSPGLQDWIARISGNAIELAKDVARVWGVEQINFALALAASALAVAGFAALGLRRRPSVLVWFTVFHAGAVLINVSSTRHLLPLMPLLGIFTASGVRASADRLRLPPAPRRLGVPLLIVAAVLLWDHGTAQVRAARREVDRVRGTPVVYRRHEAFVDLAGLQVPSLTGTDVVATNHPKILRYFLPPGIRLFTLPILQNPGTGYDVLRKAHVTYLFCDKSEPLIWDSALNIVRTHPEAFVLVAETSAGAVYRSAFTP